jgi:hypothetical protein
MQYLFALLPFLATAALASPIVKRANNQLIQSTTSGLCLSPTSDAAGVASGALGDETNVVVLDCNDAATWDISPGSGSIILSGTNYALDAGENPGAIGGVKVSLYALRERLTSALPIVPRPRAADLVLHRRPPHCHHWRYPVSHPES